MAEVALTRDRLRTLPQPLASTRERLLMAAMELFTTQGYESTSVSEILKRAGVNSGSLYYFFPGKQDVLLAVLDAYRTGIGPMLLAPAWEGVADPIERVFALLESYRQRLEATEYLYGCPIGSIALELHEPDPPVRALLEANFDGWVAAVEECLLEAGERLPPDVNRRALATFCLTTMEGGVMLSRTARTPAAFDDAVAMLRDYIRRLEAVAARS